MPEIYKSYDRESVKQKFAESFGKMLEPEEVSKLIGEKQFKDLVEKRALISLAPGRNIPIFPAFQFKSRRFREEITEVIDVIASESNISDRDFFPWPVQFLEWWNGVEKTPFIQRDKFTPLRLLRQGKKEELLQIASEYGKRLRIKT